jgi:predicted RNA-binding Zn-ribbon protein involved in translation (DUF1610 family)
VADPGVLTTCPTCGWIVTDEHIDQIARLTERTAHVTVQAVAVRCPECGVGVPGLVKVEDARRRIRSAHDDLGGGGVCTQCGRLHTAVLLHPCPTCGEPDETPIRGHHHCPPLALIQVAGKP